MEGVIVNIAIKFAGAALSGALLVPTATAAQAGDNAANVADEALAAAADGEEPPAE